MIQSIEEGYIAITKDSKMLKNYWSGGAQTGTNKQSLTDSIEQVTITENEKQLERYIDWFNQSHVNQIDFEIKKVKRVKTIKLEIINS